VSTSEYTIWNFEEEGKEVLSGALVSVNAVQAKKFGSEEMVEKFVAEIESADDKQLYSVWLDAAVLMRAFKEEAQNRKAIGDSFREREAITITFLGRVQGATYTYKNFNVEFEFTAPSQSGFERLAAGSDETAAEAITPAVSTEAPAAATTKAPTNDDIPF
jgi:hypothetical protein